MPDATQAAPQSVARAEPEPTTDGRLSNADLAPVPPDQRTWNLWHIASLWVGMSVCIPTYMLAASMIQSGMNWWQSLLATLASFAVYWLLVRVRPLEVPAAAPEPAVGRVRP